LYSFLFRFSKSCMGPRLALIIFKWAIPVVLHTVIKICRVSQTQLVNILLLRRFIHMALQNHLTHNKQNPDKCSLSGVYKLTWPYCKKVYIGQTDCDVITRYNEHRRPFRNNIHTSTSAQHLNEHMHSFGNIHVIQILQCQKKDLHLNTMERFNIHIEAASNNHLNDDHTISPTEFSILFLQIYVT
jgi:hypothetical protein